MLRVFFEEFPCSPLKNDGLKTILSLTKHKFSGDEKNFAGVYIYMIRIVDVFSLCIVRWFCKWELRNSLMDRA